MPNRILGPTAEPDLYELLRRFKLDTMYGLNCVQIGKIQSYNTLLNTAKISVNMTRKLINGEEFTYPPLEDCPVFVLSGGDASISMPIAKNDDCIVLFNDRNIDNWFSSGDVVPPADSRCHSISDGIAIVGIRNLKTAKLTPANSVCINGGSKKVSVKNSATDLKKIIDMLITQITLLTVNISTGLFNNITGLTGASTSVSAELAKLLDEGLT